MSLRRIVAVVARAMLRLLVEAVAARVRLDAMTAQVNQAVLALNTPQGRCASAESFK